MPPRSASSQSSGVDAQRIPGKVGRRVEDVVHVTEAESLPSPAAEGAGARIPSNQIDIIATILCVKGQRTLAFVIEGEFGPSKSTVAPPMGQRASSLTP